MGPDDRTRVAHMIEAAVTVRDFVADRQESQLAGDRMLLLALERAIRNLRKRNKRHHQPWCGSDRLDASYRHNF